MPCKSLFIEKINSFFNREISGDQDIVSKFREFAGPSDPELGKQIRPHSLRARFGVDKIKNALHVTDLPEDGVLEVNFIFFIFNFKMARHNTFSKYLLDKNLWKLI